MLELFQTIKLLFSQIAETPDLVDIGITLDKMSKEQCADLSAMIDFMRNESKDTASYILAQVMHDLNGLKAGFLGLPEGDCFSPRSHGYANRTVV